MAVNERLISGWGPYDYVIHGKPVPQAVLEEFSRRQENTNPPSHELFPDVGGTTGTGASDFDKFGFDTREPSPFK